MPMVTEILVSDFNKGLFQAPCSNPLGYFHTGSQTYIRFQHVINVLSNKMLMCCELSSSDDIGNTGCEYVCSCSEGETMWMVGAF